MSKFIGIALGAVAITFGVLIDVATFGALTPLLVGIAGALLTAGAGLVLSGVGTLISGSAQDQQNSGTTGGIAIASRNPIKSWDIAYGHCVIGGTLVFMNEFGDSNKYLDMVIVLPAHQCQSVDRLLFDKKYVQLSTLGGAFDGLVGDSFSPTQQNNGALPIQHIQRRNGVVTVTLANDIPLLEVGDRIQIDDNPGFTDPLADATLKGTFSVSEIVHQSFVLGTPGSIVFRYINGGLDQDIDNEGQVITKWPDYGANVHMEVLLGTQTLGTTFPGMLSGTTGGIFSDNNPWTADCSLVGKTAVFLRLHFDAKVFSGGLPSISFEIHGKNDIYDPRLGSFGSIGTTGYTENAALIIADYLSNVPWGFKAVYGSEIPLPQLIAEANISDEDVPLAIGGSTLYTTGTVSATHGSTTVTGSGTVWTTAMDGGAIIIGGYIATIFSASGTTITLRAGFTGATVSGVGYEIAFGSGFEPRYAASGTFDLSRRRGEILQNLLTACAGRLSYQGGQFILQTGAWRGSSPAPAPSTGSMSGGFRWKPKVSIRDLYNGVKGTYISAANNWHASDIPPYAQDDMHGYSGPVLYGGDSNLAADGGDRRWLDVQLPFTTSASRAQRLCKIELLSRRFMGTGTFRYNMIGYQFTALDVIAMNLPMFSWTGKLLEITAHRFVLDKQQQSGGAEVVSLGTEIDVKETDASIYDWSTTEELTPEGYEQPALPNPFTPAPPTGLILTSDLSTAVSTPAGLADTIVVAWTQPADGYVISGGHMEIQYEEVFSDLTGTVAVTNGSTTVTGTGTDWIDDMEGGSFIIGGVTYVISTVSSHTAMVLAILFAGTTAGGQSYAISYPGPWIGLPSVDPSVTQVVINGVDDAARYNVQIRSVNGAGFPSDWVSGSIVAKGASLPIPWKPGATLYPFAKSGYSFFGQVGPITAGFGSIVVVPADQMRIGGLLPTNVESQIAGKPAIDQFAAVSAHTGNTLPVMAGVLQVFGVDSGGAYTEGSNFSEFNVTATASRISFGVTWGSSTVGYEVFIGTDPDSLVGLGVQTPGSLPSTINLDSLASYPGIYGPPDPRAVSALIRGKRVIHGGIAAMFVVGSTSTTVTIQMPSAPSSNEFIGRYVIRIQKNSLPGAGPIIVGPITASDTGSPHCVLTVSGAIHGINVNDLVILSTKSDTNTATSIGDSGLVSPFATSGLTTDAEIGDGVRILFDPTGVSTGATASVLSNSSTVAQTTQFQLTDGTPVTPGAGSAYIFEQGSWPIDSTVTIGANSTAPTLAGPNNLLTAMFPVSSFDDGVVLVQVLMRDANGHLADETSDTLQMFFVPPDETVVTVTADYTVSLTNQNIMVDSTAGPIAVTVPAAAAMQARTIVIKKISSDAHVVTVVTPSGELIDGSSSATLTAQWDAVELMGAA